MAVVLTIQNFLSEVIFLFLSKCKTKFTTVNNIITIYNNNNNKV